MFLVGKIVNAAPSQPKNKHVCGVCQIQVNSEKQMAAHMMGQFVSIVNYFVAFKNNILF